MPIFKKKYEKNERRESRDMTSVPLCREDAVYLNLYALTRGVSTVTIHRAAVHNFVKGQPDKTILLHEIQSTCQRHWYHNQDSYANFNGFKNAVKVELTEAGLPLQMVEYLTDNLKEI